MSSEEFIEWLKENDWNRYHNKGDKSTRAYTYLPEDKKDMNMRGYQISCAQLCGNSHSVMRGYLWVYEDETEYLNKLAETRDKWYEANYSEEEEW